MLGRAILVVIWIFTFTLIPINTSVQMESRVAEWDNFTIQYRYLIDDGKYQLAERLLNNRIPEMEQYLKTLPAQQKDTWNALVTPLMNEEGQTSQADADRFITYVEAISAERSNEYVYNELYKFRNYLQSAPFQSGQVLNEWKRISPILSLSFKEKEVEKLSSSVTSLSNRDTFEARQEVVMQLDKLLLKEESSPLVQDAFLWTAGIIGGTIMLTLVYVGLRKFKAERRERKFHGRENS